MLRFHNGKFIIMQVSDPQDLHYVRRTMLRMLQKAYARVKPDLIVFTGDNILGNHLRDARLGSRTVVHSKEGEFRNMEKAIDHICRQPEECGVPFTMIYGNHDDMNEISKEEQAEIYRRYPHFIGLSNEDGIDCDTFHLPVYSADGKEKRFNLWFFDSAWKDKKEDRCYTAVKKETLDWYLKTSKALSRENGGKPIPSIVFQHVPMPETYHLLQECGARDEDAVLFPDHKYYRLDPSKAHGHLGEPISACELDYGEFNALKNGGDVLAVVTGHDHTNNFEGTLDGIRLIQTSCASFRCYGNRLRGVRVFELDETSPQEFRTYFLSYAELCGRSPYAQLRYIYGTRTVRAQKKLR